MLRLTSKNAWEWNVTTTQEDVRTRRRPPINHFLDIFSRRMGITVQLAGLLRIVFREQGMSEKLKTVRSLFSMNVGRGHIVESFIVVEVRFVLPRVPSVGDPICFS